AQRGAVDAAHRRALLPAGTERGLRPRLRVRGADPPARLRVRRDDPARGLLLAPACGRVPSRALHLRRAPRAGASLRPPSPSAVAEALARCFGSVEDWRKDFQAVGGLRGVGWVLLCEDP